MAVQKGDVSFAQRRRHNLAAIEAQAGDKSRKGSIDAPIVDLVAAINQHSSFFTTSSCSGRISVFAEPTPETRAAGKKGGEWVFATHDLADAAEVEQRIRDRLEAGGDLVFRFEAFILAAECRTMADAQRLVAAAREAGFRESGVTAPAARILAGLRCSLRIEAPVASQGQLLVPSDYLAYLVRLANAKMEANWGRIRRFEELIAAGRLMADKDREIASANGSPDPSGPLQQGLLPHVIVESEPHARHMIGAAEGISASAGAAEAVAADDLAELAEGHSPTTGSGAAESGLGPEKAQGGAGQHGRGHKGRKLEQAGKPKERKKKVAPAAQLRQRQEAVLARLADLEERWERAQLTAAASQPIWQPLPVVAKNLERELLNRWGHSAVVCGSKLVVFGGYGGAGAHARLADVLLWDTQSGTLTRVPQTGDWPAARTQHVAVALGNTMLLHGGRASPAQPLADTWLFNVDTLAWRQLACSQGPQPAARFRAAAVTVGSNLKAGQVYLFGGSTGDGVLGDTWRLDVGSATWEVLQCKGSAPAPRHSHAMALVDGFILLHGGAASYSHVFSDLHCLHLETLTWRRVVARGSLGTVYHRSADGRIIPRVAAASPSTTQRTAAMPSLPQGAAVRPSIAHHAAANPAVAHHSATRPTGAPCVPGLPHAPALFSHTMTYAGGALVLLGGCPAATHRHVWVLNWEDRGRGWRRVAVAGGNGMLPVRHTCVAIRGQLVVLGGGAFCFSFGSAFSPPGLLKLADVLAAAAEKAEEAGQRLGSASEGAATEDVEAEGGRPQIEAQPTASEMPPAHVLPQPTTAPASAEGLDAARSEAQAPTSSSDEVLEHAEENNPALAVSPPAMESQAGSRGTTDEQAACTGSSHVSPSTAAQPHDPAQAGLQTLTASEADDDLPETPPAGSNALVVPKRSAKAAKDALKRLGWLDQRARSEQLDDGASIALPLLEGERSGEGMAALRAALPGIELDFRRLDVQRKGGAGSTPLDTMMAAVRSLLEPHAMPVEPLLAELPRRWERLGDLVLLPAGSFASPEWDRLGPQLWAAVAGALVVQRVARQAPIANTGTRDSQVALLRGSDGWVSFRETGVMFSLDVTRCMFSSGNTTERARMGRLAGAAGQAVVDLYAGIGYYTLPLLARAGAAHVWACEWNPHALEALRRNLEANGVAERCTVLAGDCREVAPQGVADRVLLGLLPSSRGGWPAAVAALKPGGGWLHLHHNVDEREEGDWVAATRTALEELAREVGRSWQVHVRHIEHVKSYAPHINHVVLDIECAPPPPQTSPQSPAQSLTGQAVLSASSDLAADDDQSAPKQPPSTLEEAQAAGNTSRASSQMLSSALPDSSPIDVSEPLDVQGKSTITLGRSSSESQPSQSPEAASSAAEQHTAHTAAMDPPARTDPASIGRQVRLIEGASPEHLRAESCGTREPVVLRGLAQGGAAATRWSPEHLMGLPSAARTIVSAHVCPDPSGRMDFVRRNFQFRTMPLSELVERCWRGDLGRPLVAPGERYYLRSIGVNPRKEPSDINAAFPDLAAQLPGLGDLTPPGRRHSSVLRVSSPGLQLWTHYDVMDNVLLQLSGRKRLRLWPPSEEGRLYVTGSSSEVTDVDSPDGARYPLFPAPSEALDVMLEPGDALFIPALWFHSALSLDFGVCANVFWRHLDDSFYEPKDLYGNRDLAAANAAAAAGRQAGDALAGLPDGYRQFYGARLLRELAAQLGL